MSFGFSVGDFVACMLLINDVAQALQSSTGSVSEVKFLVEQLDSLMLALMSSASIHQQMKAIEIGPESKAAADAMSNGIQVEYERCKEILQAFKDSLKPYTDAFVKGKASAVTRHVRKVIWLFRKDDIAKLERNLDGHLRSLNMYKTALSEIYATSTAKNSVAILSNIVDLRVELNKISTSMVQQQTHIPRSLGYSWEANFTTADTVILLDAIGRTVVLPLVLLGSANDLREILMVMYRTIEIGRRKILRNEYTITDENSDGILLDATNWNTVVQAGTQLTLNMVFPATESFTDKVCPRCDEQTLGNTLPGQRRRCHKCQLTFRMFDKERFVEQSEMEKCTGPDEDNDNSLSATTGNHIDERFKSRKKKQILTGPSNEDFMFRSVHYHREIRRIKPVSMRPEKDATRREIDIEELPPLHKAAATGFLSEVDTLLAGGANINEPLPYQAQAMQTADWWFDALQFEGCSPLHVACWYGVIKAINHLLDRGANIMCTDALGTGIFHYACYSPNPERIFPILLRRGADPRSTDKFGCTPFHESCWLGLAWSVQFFLDHGLDLECKNEDGLTPLSFSVIGNKPQVFEILLDCGAAVDLCDDSDGSFTLHHAAYVGSLQMVQSILDLGVDPSPQNKQGDTPLHFAAFRGHVDIVDLLLSKGAVISLSNKKGETAMHQAAWNGQENIIQTLIHHGGDADAYSTYGMRPWDLAAYKGHHSLIKLLIKAVADIQSRGRDGLTALHRASHQGYEHVVAVLLEHGADVDAVDDEGGTALHRASSRGHTEVVKHLLEQNADPDVVDSQKNTALLSAASFDHRAIAILLVQHGASCSIASTDGDTPLIHASRYGNVHLVKILLEKGADITAANIFGACSLHMAARNGYDQVAAILLGHGAEVNAIDSYGRTALHQACFFGDEKTVYLLLNWGAKATIDNGGRSPLHDAGYNGNEDKVKALLRQGANPNSRLKTGETTLHWTANKGNQKALRLLIEAGANLNAQDDDGRTALHVACYDGNEETIQLLVEAGCDPHTPDRNGGTVLEFLKRRCGSFDMVLPGADGSEDSDERLGSHCT